MPSLDELAAGLRAAIATANTPGPRVFRQLRQTLVEKWRALPLGDSELARSWCEAVELVAWARRTALARGHIWPRGWKPSGRCSHTCGARAATGTP